MDELFVHEALYETAFYYDVDNLTKPMTNNDLYQPDDINNWFGFIPYYKGKIFFHLKIGQISEKLIEYFP